MNLNLNQGPADLSSILVRTSHDRIRAGQGRVDPSAPRSEPPKSAQFMVNKWVIAPFHFKLKTASYLRFRRSEAVSGRADRI